MKTRDRIKATAVALFNEKGATNVSTVQISEVMGISPGNLYYYFTNKEHIIRSIWKEDMAPQSDHIYLDTQTDNPIDALESMMDQIMQYGLKYKFFYTEQYTLFNNDPELQKIYRDRWDGLVEKLADVFVMWQEKGFMRPSSRAWKKEMVEYFLITGPANLRSNLSIHPEYSTKEALQKALNSVLLVVSGDFVDEVCEKMLTRLKG
jgi:AcrR family transcriptional regulator